MTYTDEELKKMVKDFLECDPKDARWLTPEEVERSRSGEWVKIEPIRYSVERRPFTDEEFERFCTFVGDYEFDESEIASPEEGALFLAAHRAVTSFDEELVLAVKAGRASGMSWADVGAYLRISEAEARQRYESLVA